MKARGNRELSLGNSESRSGGACKMERCGNCGVYKQQLKQKDKIIKKLLQKMQFIHEMSSTALQNIGVDKPDIKVEEDFDSSSELLVKQEPIDSSDLSSGDENSNHATDYSATSAADEFNVKMQEIIDKVIERSPLLEKLSKRFN